VILDPFAKVTTEANKIISYNEKVPYEALCQESCNCASLKPPIGIVTVFDYPVWTGLKIIFSI
jgi:hypothetical protein